VVFGGRGGKIRRGRGPGRWGKKSWYSAWHVLLLIPCWMCQRMCQLDFSTFSTYQHSGYPTYFRQSLSFLMAFRMLKQCMRALHSIWDDLRWKLGPRAEGFWSPLEVVCPCLGAKMGTEASCWAMAHWNNALATATTATTYPAPSNAHKTLWKMQNGNKYHETSWNHVVTENGLEN
jgi:hypothetical protein